MCGKEFEMPVSKKTLGRLLHDRLVTAAEPAGRA
jgi:hypothetical protein